MLVLLLWLILCFRGLWLIWFVVMMVDGSVWWICRLWGSLVPCVRIVSVNSVGMVFLYMLCFVFSDCFDRCFIVVAAPGFVVGCFKCWLVWFG